MDIKNITDGTWLVIGWFTPDYKALADKFAANLNAHGAPYHLFAKAKLGKGWNTRRKPSVVLEAMAIYPDKTLVLMDVDCIVSGDIAPVAGIDTDVGINAKPRLGRKNRIVLTLSSRVVVFNPTPRAQDFARTWETLCREAKPGRRLGDEPSMAWAYVLRPDVTYTQIDPRYSGREVGVKSNLRDTVIWHSSEHNRGRWQNPVKWLERRYFRTGNTKAAVPQRV